MLSKKQKRGFTLVELAIVLAVASLLFGGLWRLMASGSTQLRDQAVADQQKRLIDGVRAFLNSSDGQAYITASLGAGGKAELVFAGGACNPAKLCDYLPDEFKNNAKNAYSQSYRVGVRNDSVAGGGLIAYSFMVLTSGGETIADTSGGRIASMIGADGGFIYNSATSATGAYGAWTANPNDYALNGAVFGHVASRTYYGSGADQFAPWLARTNYASGFLVTNGNGISTPVYNTLRVPTYFYQKDASTLPVSGTNDLFLGNNTIFGGLDNAAVGGAITNIQSLSLKMLTPPSAGAPGMKIDMNGVGAVGLQIDMNHSSSIALAILNPSCAGDGCPTALQVNGNGVVSGQFSAGSFIYTSDVRLKHDIVTLDQSLEKLSKIRGVSFALNSDNKKRVGVLAQEVEKAYPEAVAEMSNGYKGVDYMQLVGPLIAAVNELHKRDDALAKQVQEQAAKIEALQKELAKHSASKADVSKTELVPHLPNK